MAYSAAILERARARLAEARSQCAQDDAVRIGAIYDRLPRLRQIDLALQKTAAKVCAAAFRAGFWNRRASIRKIWRRPPSARTAAGAAMWARGCVNVWRSSAGRSRKRSSRSCLAQGGRSLTGFGWTTIRRNMTRISG